MIFSAHGFISIIFKSGSRVITPTGMFSMVKARSFNRSRPANPLSEGSTAWSIFRIGACFLTELSVIVLTFAFIVSQLVISVSPVGMFGAVQ